MSYNQIEYTLRSLGVSNNTTPVVVSPHHRTQSPATEQTIPTKQLKTVITAAGKVDSSRGKTMPQERIATSLKNVDNDYQESPLSASSKSERSLAKSDRKRLNSKPNHDSRSISHNPQSRVCEHCQSNTLTQYYQINPRNRNRIDDLEDKIKQLQKQIQSNHYNPHLFKSPIPQYYNPQTPPPHQFFEEERKFIHRCVEMVSKIAKIVDPSLKFCWRFIKGLVQSPRSQYLSRQELVSPKRENKKSQIVIADLKSMLHVKHRSDITKEVASMIISQQIYQRIYQKVRKTMNINSESPSQLLHYFEKANMEE